MFDGIELEGEFYALLSSVDEQVVRRAAQERCRFCRGPLHRGDYPRKPRGGVVAALGEAFTRRYSLCCGREGCRHRATPPSVRFLGRRVYVGAAVVVASVVARVVASAAALRRTTGIPPRTTRRWLAWWRGAFTATSVFKALSARMVPPPVRLELPTSILARLAGAATARLTRLLAWLAPLTTTSSPHGSRFVRGAM
jgi:hypothetical protein